jgi:hypothetical protein
VKLLTEGMQEAQADLDNKEGVFNIDIRRKKEAELLAMVAKGMPGGISDVVLSKMLLKDMYYFNKDFT